LIASFLAVFFFFGAAVAAAADITLAFFGTKNTCYRHGILREKDKLGAFQSSSFSAGHENAVVHASVE
jgi:hypothetical protein